MILVLLMRKLVMLDKIHRTNLYFVKYTNVIIKNISIYQGEQNLGEKRQTLLWSFSRLHHQVYVFFYIILEYSQETILTKGHKQTKRIR